MRAIRGGGGMARLELASARALRDRVGQEVGVSDWLEITQERIDRFAQAGGDHQWIHVDVERARRESPFRAPVAHGFLTLSLLSRLLTDTIALGGSKLGVNYGLNRVRFTAPVPVGSRLRARFTLKALDEIDGGVQLTWSVTMEREGSDKPCMVAEWLTRRYD
jgi:acyl dehydratase